MGLPKGCDQVECFGYQTILLEKVLATLLGISKIGIGEGFRPPLKLLSKSKSQFLINSKEKVINLATSSDDHKSHSPEVFINFLTNQQLKFSQKMSLKIELSAGGEIKLKRV